MACYNQIFRTIKKSLSLKVKRCEVSKITINTFKSQIVLFTNVDQSGFDIKENHLRYSHF